MFNIASYTSAVHRCA